MTIELDLATLIYRASCIGIVGAAVKILYSAKKALLKPLDDINKKLANDSTELALIKQKLDTISWISKTTLAAVIVAIVGALRSLILK